MMLSIVILTRNSRRDIGACLDSVFAQEVPGLEVIVIDNASTDGTCEWIRTNRPQVRLIENERNLGASKGRNQGIERAAGKWILALDSDVTLDQGFLGRFMAQQDKLPPEVGMVQPNVLDAEGGTIYSHGIHLSPLKRFFDVNRGKSKEHPGIKKRPIIGPCSAAAFYRRSMLDALREKTGYFDERFFFLVEDVDLAWRASRAGWKTIFDPRMVCFHKGNGSATNGKLRQYLSFRNRWRMIVKNEGFWGRIILFVISLPYDLTRTLSMMFWNRYFWTGAR